MVVASRVALVLPTSRSTSSASALSSPRFEANPARKMGKIKNLSCRSSAWRLFWVIFRMADTQWLISASWASVASAR